MAWPIWSGNRCGSAGRHGRFGATLHRDSLAWALWIATGRECSRGTFTRQDDEPYLSTFADGNASIARLLVRTAWGGHRDRSPAVRWRNVVLAKIRLLYEMLTRGSHRCAFALNNSTAVQSGMSATHPFPRGRSSICHGERPALVPSEGVHPGLLGEHAHPLMWPGMPKCKNRIWRTTEGAAGLHECSDFANWAPSTS